ncbi:hypothetical protein ANTPLA_LOCUS5603 [Anthophora plagiata]
MVEYSRDPSIFTLLPERQPPERERKRKREEDRQGGEAGRAVRGMKAVVYDFGSEPRTFQRSLSDLTRYAGGGLKISSDTPST